MKKGQRVSISFEIKNKENKIISKMKDQKATIKGPANNDKSAYYVKLDDGLTLVDAISTKYITKI